MGVLPAREGRVRDLATGTREGHMTKADWSEPTTDGEASARSRGRRRFNALQRDRAEARRSQVRKRLPALQAEAWAAYPQGVIPRVTTGGMLHGALAAIADELGVSRTTIHNVVQTILRAAIRREELAPRLLGLREEYGVGRKGRLPKDIVWRLSCEFGCKPYDIRRDIREIILKWDLWAQLRQPRPKRFTRQLCTLFDEETYEKLVATGHPARIIRQAVEAWLSTGTHHSPDDCAMAVVQTCDPDTQSRLLRSAMRLERSLTQVLTSLVYVGLKKEA